MGQLLSAAVLVSFVAGALAFNVIENQPKFTNETIQIGLVAEDFEETLGFYTEVIGMQHTGGFSLDAAFGKSSGLSGGAPVDVAILKLADSPAANQLKIVNIANPPKAKPSQYIQDRAGMRYMTLYVDNVDPFIQRFGAHGIKLLGDTPVKIDDGRRFLLVEDPNGVFVEIIGQ